VNSLFPKYSKTLFFSFLFLGFGWTGNLCLAQSQPVVLVEYNSGFHTITEALDHLKTLDINSNLTLQLNARNYLNEPNYLSTENINMNGYHLSIQGKSPEEKSRILMDGSTAHVFDNHLSNFSLKNVILEGANPKTLNGSIFRQKGMEENISLDHVDMIGGYCGIRATTKINGLYLSNIVSSRVPHGTFRIGNGSFSGSRSDTMLWERDSADYDMWNVEISNITLLDDLDNDTIPGSEEVYNGFLLLKKIYNLKLNGITAPKGNGGGILSIENSRHVTIQNVNVTEYGYNQPSSSGFYIFKCDYVDVFNNILKTKEGDSRSHVSYHFIISDQISFCHNTGIASRFNDRVIFGFQLSHINSFEGNLIKMKDYACIIGFREFDNYQATMANDWKSIDQNAWSNTTSSLPLFNLEELDGRTYIVMHNNASTKLNQLDFSEYQNDFQKGVNSVFAYPESRIFFRKFSYYQKDGSLGRNMVSESRIDYDLNGALRTLPTDAGALDADFLLNINSEELEEDEESKFSLYPNPNDGSFKIEFPNHYKEIKLKLIDAHGRSVGFSSNQTLRGGKNTIEIDLGDNKAPGIYTLRLTLNEEVHHQSFILK
tara:strand:+ start:22891 stop:24690 length:1800 start_codon:yes stop_codon:yes gene_type:complete